MIGKSNRSFMVIAFSIFFCWIMSFAYEGPVMFALANNRGLDEVMLNVLSVIFHAGGLFLGQYVTKSLKMAKQNTLYLATTALILSLAIFFINIHWWSYLLPIISFLMGLVISTFAYMIRAYTDLKQRSKIAADLLIYGNIILIIAHMLANNVKAEYAFLFIEGLFLVALIAVSRLNLTPIKEEKVLVAPITTVKVKITRFWIFFLFIFLLSINSGIMFRVIYPYFESFSFLTSLYTNVPYIVAIYIIARMINVNKFQFLYIGLGFWAITFILFSIMGQTALAFVIIYTFMLSACGIFDLFWWSTMLENMEIVKNPSGLLGIGLSFNVFGVWVGNLLGGYISAIGNKQTIAIIGLSIVVVSTMIVLPLNLKLSQFLTYNKFLTTFESRDLLEEVEKLLSVREFEVFLFLIVQKTDKEISESLYISHNTVKTHNWSIYKKLEVANRKELKEKYS